MFLTLSFRTLVCPLTHALLLFLLRMLHGKGNSHKLANFPLCPFHLFWGLLISMSPEYHFWDRLNSPKLSPFENCDSGLEIAIFWTFGKPWSWTIPFMYHVSWCKPLVPQANVRRHNHFLPRFLFLHQLPSQWDVSIWSSTAAPSSAFYRRELAAISGKETQNSSALLSCWIRHSTDLLCWFIFISMRVLGEMGRRLRVSIDFFQICQVSCWFSMFLCTIEWRFKQQMTF